MRSGSRLRVSTTVGILAIAVSALGTASTAAAADGAAIYAKECARCHGADGTGDTPVGKAMKVTPLAGNSQEEVVAFVRSSSKHKAPSGKLSDDDLAAVATKVAGF
jgi:mono/diheme cytochrome c family protein